jgi:hypothetical protein
MHASMLAIPGAAQPAAANPRLSGCSGAAQITQCFPPSRSARRLLNASVVKASVVKASVVKASVVKASSTKAARTRHQTLLGATGGAVFVEYVIVLAFLASVTTALLLAVGLIQIPAYSLQRAALYRPYP